jgi:hypothetical protein
VDTIGEPPLLAGEDAAAYDELLGRLWAVLKPRDIIEEFFVYDLARLQWDCLRYQRLKTTLIRAHELRNLKDFLTSELEYEDYSDHFVDQLTNTLLEHNYPEDKARKLAQACSRNEPDAVEEVNTFLAQNSPDLDLTDICDRAKEDKAKELVQEFLTAKRDAVGKVRELLAVAGKSMDDISADAFSDFIDVIERIERLTTLAETRRNANLHEIERLRTPLGHAMRRFVQEIDDANFSMIEPPGKGKKIA